MLSDDFSAQMGGKSETPEALGGSPVTFHIHTVNAHDVWEQALAAGAEVTMPLADQFTRATATASCADRSGTSGTLASNSAHPAR